MSLFGQQEAPEIPEGVFSAAVRKFWGERDSSAKEQAKRGASDQGDRSKVTRAKHMGGFQDAIVDLLIDTGVASSSIHIGSYQPHVPGFFRSSKAWDVVVASDTDLLVAIELKSIAGSFGKNLNNRSEEALGNAVDLKAAFESGAFGESEAPWLGYLFVLADVPETRRPVKPYEPRFEVLDDFKQASYAERAELLCRKLVQEGHYDSACFMVADPQRVEENPNYAEPATDLGAQQFLSQLLRHVRSA